MKQEQEEEADEKPPGLEEVRASRRSRRRGAGPGRSEREAQEEKRSRKR